MGQEIERKFLVISKEWQKHALGVLYKQGYLSKDKERIVRVRMVGKQGYLTIKGERVGIKQPEFEYKIPEKDAQFLLDNLCLRPGIDKKRYRIQYGNFLWEIDEFLGENEGLILAEVELPEETTPLSLPPWVGEEVSLDPRYSNSELMQNPYKSWGRTKPKKES